MSAPPPEVATARIIRNAARKIGGKAALRDLLYQFSLADKSERHLELKRQLEENVPLEKMFEQISEGGPYVEIYWERGVNPPQIQVSYDCCYGGTCGSGHTHYFQKKGDTWKILPGAGEMFIH